MMGATVGTLFAALNRAGMRRFWRAPNTQLNVVITGASKGIGKAIAREFLRQVMARYIMHKQEETKTAAVGCSYSYSCTVAGLLCFVWQCHAQPHALHPQLSGRASTLLQRCRMRCHICSGDVCQRSAECCRSGDRVLVTSRTLAGVRAAAANMRDEVLFCKAAHHSCLCTHQHRPARRYCQLGTMWNGHCVLVWTLRRLCLGLKVGEAFNSLTPVHARIDQDSSSRKHTAESYSPTCLCMCTSMVTEVLHRGAG